jgi:CTP synthase
MQCALIEFARNVMNLPEADSTEFNPTTTVPIIEPIIQTKSNKLPKRRGAIACKLNLKSKTFAAYGEEIIHERFCHLYKVNNAYRGKFAAAGIIEAAISEDKNYVETIELTNEMHPWFVGVQFHPEFKSRITRPSPIILTFIAACKKV